MRTITTGNRQSLLDLAMQHAGSAEEAFALSVQNDIPITIELEAATVLPAPAVVNQDIVTLYKVDKVKPCSILNSEGTGDNMEGIGYWIIQDDFITS